MLQELFLLNQLTFATKVLLKILIQSFYHPIYSIAEIQLFNTSSCVACRSGLEGKLGVTWICGYACAIIWHSRTLPLFGHNHTLPIGQLLRHFRVRQCVSQNGCMVLETKAEGLCSTCCSHVFVLLFNNLILSVLQ
jgi:hypothetical protein